MAVLLALAPLLLLLASLLAGRYVGEERIARLAARGCDPPTRRARVARLGPDSAPASCRRAAAG